MCFLKHTLTHLGDISGLVRVEAEKENGRLRVLQFTTLDPLFGGSWLLVNATFHASQARPIADDTLLISRGSSTAGQLGVERQARFEASASDRGVAEAAGHARSEDLGCAHPYHRS